MKKTINQIKAELEEIANAHQQVNTFFWGDLLRAWKEEEIEYPLMCAYYPDASFLYNQTELQLVVIIADKHYKDWNINLDEVESDTLQIARDIFNTINSSKRWNNLLRVDGCTVNKFINDTGDECAGHTMTFNIKLRENSGVCGLPMGNYDFDQVVSSGECEDATYTVEYADGTLIESGTIPSGGSKTVTVPDCPTCDDATWTLKDTAGNVLNTGTIASGGSADIVSPDATAVLKDSAGTTLSTTTILSGGTDNITAPDASVTINGDNSFPDIKSGGSENIVVENTEGTPVGAYDGGSSSWVLPNSDINVNSVNEGSVVSVKDIDINVTDSNGSVTPDSVTIVGNTVTIDVPDSSPTPVGATLMRSGAQTVYRTGDDADTKDERRATDFFTLANANPFGTTSRFTDELGGGTYTNNIVIDWSTYDKVAGTVLGYYRLSLSSVNWSTQIDAALALSIGTFTTGWRLWNINECVNILNYNIGNAALSYSPFNNSGTGNYHTSTSRDATFAMKRNGMQVFLDAKSNSSSGIAVRTFTVTGTTLT
jgi:hypothetical protein